MRRPIVMLIVALTGSLALSGHASAGIYCTLTNFKMAVSDDGGVYLHGTLNGQPVNFIRMCNFNGSTQDCTTKATDRRIAAALAAQISGRELNLYFDPLSSCPTTNYPYPNLFEVLN